MGSIKRFNLTRIIREYHTPHFFETGTFWGDGVEYALQSPFKKVASVEIVPEIAQKARIRFEGVDKVEIIENSSSQALIDKIPAIDGNCVFWLDAHFPGADAGLNRYDENPHDALRLPLQNEIETIRRLREGFNDVLIIDDLRIYEEGPFENGNVPPDALPATERNIDFVYAHFHKTHVIVKCYLDEGYVLVFPKRAYYRNFLLNRLKLRYWRRKDFYLTARG